MKKLIDKFYYLKNHLLRLKLIKKQGYDSSHGYSLIKDSKTLDLFEKLKSGSYFIKQADGYDEYGYLSNELGNELEQLFMDDDYVIGIHRTGEASVTDELLDDIFSNGLINAGKTLQTGSFDNSSFDINNTVSIFNKFQHIISQIKASHQYKASDGCIIIKIPKSSIGLDSKNPIPLYHIQNGKYYINPEYIYGYVPVDFKGNVGDIVYNPNYNKQHEYDYPAYDCSVIENAKEILFRNYELTYNKYDKKQADTALINFIIRNDTSYFTGENNRKLLNSRVDIYNFIKKIMYPNGINNNDLQRIIDNYENRILQEKSKGITK